ncbi:DUF3124 domain-containing protein [Ferriphaselus sp. R-1]|uniref:DUF3124 domain-containing protein n=1 Tax=Ferriphaselus sp. R-1 TaxID=1485544 RepID=UPI00068C3794|nr:DUF3124 domain-containing protein [Ferriphaselus sp. R-1]
MPDWKSLLCAGLLLGAVSAQADELSRGQVLYLPIYSHIWYGDMNADGRPKQTLMSALVSIRNTSHKVPIRVSSARYYSTEGKLLKEFLPTTRTVAPMGTLELFVERKESEGGSGANFIIQWEASMSTNSPVVEAVHADIQVNRTPTFITVARPLSPEN